MTEPARDWPWPNTLPAGGAVLQARRRCVDQQCASGRARKLTPPQWRCYIDHSKTKPTVEGSMGRISGFQQFLQILTVPDNVPIIAMMILVMFFTYIALMQARRNDQLIEHGHRERIIDEMRK